MLSVYRSPKYSGFARSIVSHTSDLYSRPIIGASRQLRVYPNYPRNYSVFSKRISSGLTGRLVDLHKPWLSTETSRLLSQMTSHLEDHPDGPLSHYRKQASFDWKKLKLLIEGEESIKFKNQIYETLSRDPLFVRDFKRLSLEENRAINHQRWKAVLQHGFIDDFFADMERTHDLVEVLEMYDQGLSARYALHSSVFYSAVMSMGTKRHNKILEQATNNEIVGCFCLTEVSHGSNTQEIGTTATFDKGEFVFDTPHDGAIKCWAGNLAQSATHAVVFAQLHVGGTNHGMHAFVLQVRDPHSYRPMPGITIGDMGEKPGTWNGVENGWMEFKHHRAPLWTLLNKGSDVTPDGRYVSTYKTTQERQSVSLGALSIGRIGIVGKGVIGCQLAATIALRYSAVRKQFGPPKKEELPVIEYPLQRHRLFPLLAQGVAVRLFHKKLIELFREYMMRVMSGEKSEELTELSKEVHALSSSAKPVATWLGVTALGEARRACGGHGFLHMSRLNSLRDDFDPSQTFEGENNILLQQTSNYLLGQKKNGHRGSPMHSTDFLKTPAKKFEGNTQCPVTDILSAYAWLIEYLIAEMENAHKTLRAEGRDAFQARNETQVHLAHTLSKAYAERTMIAWSQDFVDQVDDSTLKPVLQRLNNIFALSLIDNHLSTLYIGGYTSGPSFGQWVRQTIRQEETDLAPDALAIVDAIAPPDLVLNSALGASDGRAYDHILAEFRRHTDPRPEWWADLAQFLENNRQKSKL